MKEQNMRHERLRRIFFYVTTLALVLLVVLWSFNALSDLLGGPPAQFKHAVAAVGLLLIMNWSRRNRGHNHDCRGDVCGH
jgi:hypothetical protein